MKTRLSLKVVPGAAKPGVAGWLGEALKVRVAAPPEKGKANRAVESLLAEALGLSAGDVCIVAGHGSPRKVVEIAGLTLDAIRQRLEARRKD